MKMIFIKFVVNIIKLVYIPFKLLNVQNKVTIISRQSDVPSDDIIKVEKYIKKKYKKVKVVILAKKINKGLINKVLYMIHMLKQMYHISTSKSILLDGYCIVVSIIKHKKDVIIVQMWHACCAIKKFGWQIVDKQSGTEKNIAETMKMHNNYSYVIAPSKITAEHYKEAFKIKDTQIKFIGLPHIEDLNSGDDYIKIKNSLFNIDCKLDNKINILYIPTFRKEKVIDLSVFEKYVDFNKYNFIVGLHPLSNYKNKSSKIILADSFSTYNWMKLADIILTDYSSLALEVALMNRRLYFYLYDYDSYCIDPGLNIDIFNEKIGKYAFKQLESFNSILNDEYDFESLKDFRNKYFEVSIEDSTKQLVELLLDRGKE